MNSFDAKLTKSNGRYFVNVYGVVVELSEDKQKRLIEKNVEEQDITLGVRPDHIVLTDKGIEGTVNGINFRYFYKL